jgi:hypothetical protein
MAQYSEAQKEEARKIKQRCLEILEQKKEALMKQNLDLLTKLELESEKLSERIDWLIENPNEYKAHLVNILCWFLKKNPIFT